MEIKGKIICKKSDNKAFKLGDDWYNVNDNVVPYLEKISKGDEVTVIYEKKGASRYVSKLSSGKTETPKEEATTSSTGFVCEVCGKALKDNKYKKCFMCNKSGAEKKETATSKEEPKKYTPQEGIRYGSPEDIAGKEIGCALGAAATIAGGCAFSDPETAKQFTLELAEAFIEWMRAKK